MASQIWKMASILSRPQCVKRVRNSPKSLVGQWTSHVGTEYFMKSIITSKFPFFSPGPLHRMAAPLPSPTNVARRSCPNWARHVNLPSPSQRITWKVRGIPAHVRCLPVEEDAGLILGLHPANERRRYFGTTSLIGWVQALNQPWDILMSLQLSKILTSVTVFVGPIRYLCLFQTLKSWYYIVHEMEHFVTHWNKYGKNLSFGIVSLKYDLIA